MRVWMMALALVSSLPASAAGPCPASWNPGGYDEPLKRMITIQGEGGLGFLNNAAGAGKRGEASSDPWYIGLGGTAWTKLPGPASVLVDARYGRGFSVGRQRLNTSLWGARGVVLFGSSSEEVKNWARVLDVQVTGDAMGNTITTTEYCPETSATRKYVGYGAGVHVDRLTGTLGFTLDGARLVEVYREDRALMFEAYAMYGPPRGLAPSKMGAGATLRLVRTEGTMVGGAIEGWWRGGMFAGEGGGLLITGFVGAGGVNGS